MVSVRNILNALGTAFTVYLAALGLWWSDPIAYPLLDVAALALYVVTTLLCIYVDRRPRVAAVSSDADADDDLALTAGVRGLAPLPGWACALALACAVIVPAAVTLAAGPASRTASFATAYIGGIGALMTIVMVRRRPWVAWIGIVILALQSMVWLGVVSALALGLVGSLMWVTVAQLLMMSMDRAARDTVRLAQLQRAASAWRAAQSGRRRERRVQVQRALAVAGPVLSRTIATGGALSEAERAQARLAEGSLRDELRAPRLLDADVRDALDAARRRGATVTVLDEGGLDDIADDALDAIRSEVAEAVRDANSDRLYIRTSPDPQVAVTVVGRSSGGDAMSDEDDVDLWREIPHRSPHRPGGGGIPGR